MPTSIEPATRQLVVAPSAFGFLYDECKACYYNQVHGIRKRPRTPFPSIFNTIDHAMKAHLAATQCNCFNGDGRSFAVESQGRWVLSTPIPIDDTDLSIVIRGSYDTVLRFANGRSALCDLKTAPVKAELVSKYSRQLHGYTLALECPARGSALLVDELGLAVFEPSTFAMSGVEASLSGTMTWLPVDRDDAAFHHFIQEVGQLLAAPVAPAPAPDCGFCIYREAA